MNGITTASTHRWVSEKLERRCTTQTRAASSAASPRQLRTENIDYAHISRPAKSTWWAGNHAPKEPAARTEITIQQASVFALPPAHSQMPPQFVPARLLQHAFIFPQLPENGNRLRTKGDGRLSQKANQRPNRCETFRRIKPLRLRQIQRPFRIPRPLVEQQAHRILVRGK